MPSAAPTAMLLGQVDEEEAQRHAVEAEALLDDEDAVEGERQADEDLRGRSTVRISAVPCQSDPAAKARCHSVGRASCSRRPA